jgi:hypothetical protein
LIPDLIRRRHANPRRGGTGRRSRHAIRRTLTESLLHALPAEDRAQSAIADGIDRARGRV